MVNGKGNFEFYITEFKLCDHNNVFRNRIRHDESDKFHSMQAGPSDHTWSKLRNKLWFSQYGILYIPFAMSHYKEFYGFVNTTKTLI